MAYDKIVDSAALDGALTNIADAIRGKTGSTQKLTLEGMVAAIAGIGTGGGSGGASGIYMAKVTPAEDVGKLIINHNLGTTDILLAAAWAETLGDVTPVANATVAKFWAKTSMQTQRGGNGFGPGYTWNVTNSYAHPQAPNTASYETLTITDENNVSLNKAASGSTNMYLAGVTYHVVVIAANMGV